MIDEVAEESAVPTKIVVGTDGSDTAGRALRKAIGLAKAVAAELIIIDVYKRQDHPSHCLAADGGRADWSQFGERVRHRVCPCLLYTSRCV